MNKTLIITSALVILIVGGVFSTEQIEQSKDKYSKDWYAFEHITNNYEEYKNYKITKMVNNERIGNAKQAKNVIKVDVPLILLLGRNTVQYLSYILTYERVLSKNISLSVTPQMRYPADSLIDTPILLGVILTPRWYPSKTKYTPSGWFVGFPFVLSLVMTDLVGISVGAEIGGGYQWILRDGFTLDIFTDIGLLGGFYKDEENPINFAFPLPLFRLGINLGYAF